MKNRFTVLLMTTFTIAQMVACSDSDSTGSESHETDVVQNLDVTSTEDVIENDGTSEEVLQPLEDAASDNDAGESSSDVTAVEVDESEQLPADPTEDPEQESSYYEFPAWNIPAPSEGQPIKPQEGTG